MRTTIELPDALADQREAMPSEERTRYAAFAFAESADDYAALQEPLTEEDVPADGCGGVSAFTVRHGQPEQTLTA